MARRPKLFSQKEFEDSLRRQHCPDNFISPTVSDFCLLVPLIIRELGEDALVAILEKTRAELQLGAQKSFWTKEAPYIVGWAEEQIEQYKAQKDTKPSP